MLPPVLPPNPHDGSRYVRFVTLGIRVAVTLVTTVFLAACGGGDASSEMRLTLTDDCTYEGDETPAAGAFTVEVENKSSKDGAFSRAGVASGATSDDYEAYLEKVQQRLQQGKGLLDPPAFYSQAVRVSVASGTSSRLPADVAAGTYVLTCFIEDPPTAIYLGTPLEVSA